MPAVTIEELEAEIKRLKGLMLGDPDVIEAHFSKEGCEIELQHWAIRLLAASLWQTFSLEGGPNFVSMDVGGLSDKGPIEVTIRPRWGTKTPTQLLNEAKAEIEKLKGEIEILRSK